MNDQAIQLHSAGRTPEAIALLRQALALSPDQAMLHNNLGELLRLSGQTDAALPHLDQAIALQPSYADAYSNRGNLLRQLGKPAEAAENYRTALRLRPHYPEALSNLATALMDLQDFAAAAAMLRQAIGLSPGMAVLHKNLMLALTSLGDYAGAEAAFDAMERAGGMQAGLVDAMILRGDLARAKNDLDDALVYYEKAWRLVPGHAEAHMRFGTAKMVQGDYRTAWPHFGARWNMADAAYDRRPFTLPFWKGETLPLGQKMLLFTEQGVGESLVLWSLMPELLAFGIRPVVETDPRMVPLLQRSFPGIEFLERANPPAPRLLQPDLVVQATLFDLATVFRAAPEDCTGALPLKADKTRAAQLRAQYQANDPRPLIGIAWHSANPRLGAPKSARPIDLAPLLTLPGYRFVDLQYGNRADDRSALEAYHNVSLLYDPAIDQLKDLDGFAAQVAAMDMVISTSNTTAHMAAALGKPTWLMLHKGVSPHWYWTREGSTTPWYPTARLWRQQTAGDWTGLAQIIAAELPKVL